MLGIIIVALATILRRETYGIKSILWKIVIMAILVNFVLVIASPLIGFSSSLTNFFLAKFPGGDKSDCASLTTATAAAEPLGFLYSGTGTNCLAKFNGFADGIAGAFQPQRLIAPENGNNSGNISASTVNAAFQGGGSDLGSIISAAISVIAAQVTLLLIVIVLAVFFFMLLVRYLYLVFLLIIAPFAWMFWVFPKTKQHFEKWWETFIKWTFFPPIVMFFMWLVLTVGNVTQTNSNTVTINSNAAGTVGNFFQSFLAGALQSVLGTVMQDLVVIGLMLGGMYVASKMSITGASAAMSAAKGVGKSIKGYAGKQSKKAGRAAFRKAGGENLVRRMRTGNIGILKGLPGAQHVSGVIGRAVQPHLSNKDLVEEAKKHVSDNPKEILENLANPSMNKETQLASVQKLLEKNNLEKVGNDPVMVGVDEKGNPRTMRDYLDSLDREDEKNNGSGFQSYGQSALKFDADNAMLSNRAMREMEKALVDLKTSGGDTTNALKALNDAAQTFLKTRGKGEVNTNAVFAERTPLVDAIVENMAKSAPHLIPNVLSKGNSKALDIIQKSYEDQIIYQNVGISHTNLRDPELRKKIPKDIREKWNIDKVYGSLANNVFFSAEAAPGQSTPGTPPPPPPNP